MAKSIKTLTPKSDTDVLDYDYDCSKWFKTIPEDEIARFGVQIDIYAAQEATPQLVSGPIPHPAYKLLGDNPHAMKLWFGGGTPNVTYEITVTITTNADRVKEGMFKMKVIA